MSRQTKTETALKQEEAQGVYVDSKSPLRTFGTL